jgi:hypothetical protein
VQVPQTTVRWDRKIPIAQDGILEMFSTLSDNSQDSQVQETDQLVPVSKLKPVFNLNKKSTVGIVPVNCTGNSCARKKTQVIFHFSLFICK